MRKISIVILFSLLHVLGFAQEKILAIKNVSVIDVKNNKIQANTVVLIKGDKITAINKKVSIPKEAIVIDGTGKYLIPGLWDMHTHTLRAERIEAFFPLFIANGVTGIRDMAMPLENLELLKQWRREIKSGHRIGL